MSSTSMAWRAVRRLRLDADDIDRRATTEVDRVHALIHQRATPIQGEGSSPKGIAVVLGRAIPLHARIYQQDLAEIARKNRFFEVTKSGLRRS